MDRNGLNPDEAEEADEEEDLSQFSDEEKLVIQDCLLEAVWYRSIPMAALTGGFIFVAVRRGLMKPSLTLGPWPKVLLGGFLAYWTGKLSYVVSHECKDKFVRDAPKGAIAKTIREDRAKLVTLKQMKIEDFDNTIDIPGYDPQSGEIPPLSDGESDILEECNQAANIYYSFPTLFLFGVSTHMAQVKGYIKETVSIRNPKLSRWPKTLLAAFTGYAVGQYLYALSPDCSERFLYRLPHSNMARYLRNMDYFEQYGRYPPPVADSRNKFVINPPPDLRIDLSEGVYSFPSPPTEENVRMGPSEPPNINSFIQTSIDYIRAREEDESTYRPRNY